MTEQQPGTTPAPEAPAGPAGTPRTGGRRTTVALIAVAVAALALVGGGVWASSALADADRTAPTAYWVEAGGKPPEVKKPEPVPVSLFSGKLLPVPSGFAPGPDLAGDGNDFFISGDKATEGFKEARKGLSNSERKKRDDMLADLKLKGVAGRSYTGDRGFVVEIRIMQADPRAVGAFAEVSKKLLDLIGDDRDAPKVDGFPDAKCSLLAVGEEKHERIDSLYCVAVEGDVMVNFRAYGPKESFSKSDAATFLKNQLTHLKSPGESV
ncbi:hypothetical protein [Streptomyces sp. NPDC059564]|uniref:hypothetical protein n=1 Tax=Streptomyces sp. NPDC059564 TaxID=3346865 RepID=UPI0036BB43DC